MTQNIENNSTVNKIDDEIIDNLVKYIISLKVDLKSRRYDEEAQTDSVKEQWLKKTLKNDPALFLEKWGKHLKQSDLAYFDPLSNDYEIAYHLKALRKNNISSDTQNLNKNKNDVMLTDKVIRNRRYNYVQRHPEYFTLENLQERNPYEYEEYIGQYIPEDKRVEFQPFQNNMSLVERMYFDIDHQRMNDEIEEMEDILYQEEEKEKEEDKRDNDLIKKKERKVESKENEIDNENKNKKEKNLIPENKKDKEQDSLEKNEIKEEKNNIVNKNEEIKKSVIDSENSNEEIPSNNINNSININTARNDDDNILKFTDKNEKFYQTTNIMDEEEDFVEEEDDSDEEYNEETILKEIERRRELKRQEQALKEKNKQSMMSSTQNSKNNTKEKRTKIRIINPAYYDNDNNKSLISNSNKNINNTSNQSQNNQIKSQIKSVEDIFNIKDDNVNNIDNNNNNSNNNNDNRNENIENNREEYNDEDDEISEELKQYYYNEFINIMKKEFIDGNDKNFDYSMVDNCEDYDDIQQYEQDMHERYFEDNDDIFYYNHQNLENLQKRYYDERKINDTMEDILAEENYFD